MTNAPRYTVREFCLALQVLCEQGHMPVARALHLVQVDGEYLAAALREVNPALLGTPRQPAWQPDQPRPPTWPHHAEQVQTRPVPLTTDQLAALIPPPVPAALVTGAVDLAVIAAGIEEHARDRRARQGRKA